MKGLGWEAKSLDALFLYIIILLKAAGMTNNI